MIFIDNNGELVSVSNALRIYRKNLTNGQDNGFVICLLFSSFEASIGFDTDEDRNETFETIRGSIVAKGRLIEIEEPDDGDV